MTREIDTQLENNTTHDNLFEKSRHNDSLRLSTGVIKTSALSEAEIKNLREKLKLSENKLSKLQKYNSDLNNRLIKADEELKVKFLAVNYMLIITLNERNVILKLQSNK